VVCAHRVSEVPGVLAEVESAVAKGLHAAGFITYEAAPGLDGALVTWDPGQMPLVWFGLFRQRRQVRCGALPTAGRCRPGEWVPSVTRGEYDHALNVIHAHIAAGDTYQVNYTFRLRTRLVGDCRALYRDLCQRQRAACSAYIDTGRFRLLSASPESFVARQGSWLTTRPMKGTRPRGRWPAEDEALAHQLRSSPKDRAENVMIVDLLRNDLGRVAVTGSVEVPWLWAVERYPTVLQMTSTVSARLQPDVGLVALLRALFPCGSITGAPKVRTMQLIRQLETTPREVYTGAIGFLSPGQVAHFSVPIRTVWVDGETGQAEYGVGGGITHDSSAAGEYEECRVKARLLSAPARDFALLETLLYEPGQGYFLLARHLQRLMQSARYFGFVVDEAAVCRALAVIATRFGPGHQRVRLQVGRDGVPQVQSQPVPSRPPSAWRAALAVAPVDENDPLLFHKTTWREPYDQAAAGRPDCDQVILHNRRGQVTEAGIGNLVAVLDGQVVTPPVPCGLLAGTFRDELLARGWLAERVLYAADLRRARQLFLVNSVRRWVPLVWID
jgi:para-aminobenzoate synthetase/4-amino-4-deoxychorismate lyase